MRRAKMLKFTLSNEWFQSLTLWCSALNFLESVSAMPYDYFVISLLCCIFRMKKEKSFFVCHRHGKGLLTDLTSWHMRCACIFTFLIVSQWTKYCFILLIQLISVQIAIKYIGSGHKNASTLFFTVTFHKLWSAWSSFKKKRNNFAS